MAKLRLEIELDYDADLIYGDDPAGREWFFKVLGSKGDLSLHSNEIGDSIGSVTVRRFLDLSDFVT